MINMFPHMACICHFVCFFALPRASYGYIQCGFIPSVVWRFSNIFFRLFRCRNLALNRAFSYFLVADMFFILGGGWMPPTFVHPLYICTPPVHSYAPGVYTPLYAPLLLCASVCSQRLCMLWEVVRGCLSVRTLPLHHPDSFPIVFVVLALDRWNYCSGEQA